MSLYNTCTATMACPSCGQIALREIQFRFGHVRLYESVVGSRLVWGPDAVGEPQDVGEIAVDGWLDQCAECGHEGRHAVFIRDQTIYGTGPISWVPDLPDQGWLRR